MAVERDRVPAEIESQWTYLTGIIARLPTHQMENAVVVGTWPVKDLLGHITTWESETWESETIENIERFLDLQGGDTRSYRDEDNFNAEAAQAKKALTLGEASRDLEETHARLLEFLNALPEPAFHREMVSRRIKLDTHDHYKEHAETLIAWLEAEGT